MNIPGVVNLDFADVTAIMKDAGYAHMGVGSASGKDKARAAAEAAISSPLLETSINGAKGVIVNITASPDIDLDDIDVASSMIHEAAHPDVNLIWGATFDDTLQDEMKVTVIATGFDSDQQLHPPQLQLQQKDRRQGGARRCPRPRPAGTTTIISSTFCQYSITRRTDL